MCSNVTTCFYIVLQLVPSFDVTINGSNEQIVGQPLTLECNIGSAKNTDSTFDVVWTRDRTIEVRRVKNISGSLFGNYSDYYTISQIRRSDIYIRYRCDIIINFNQPSNTSGFFLLFNVTRKFDPL